MSEMVEFLEVGKITGIHGIKGALKVLPLTDDAARFKDLDFVYIQRNSAMERLDIKEIGFLKKHVILAFRGIDSASEAEKYKNMYILVDRENAVRLPEDSFFICDIIGCNVYNDSGALLGQVKEVLHTGSNDVYVVQSENGKEYLIPALKSVVREVSVADKKITVVLPEGLMEDEI